MSNFTGNIRRFNTRSFGIELLNAMISRNMSNTELANKMGYVRSVICSYVNGERAISITKFAEFVVALDLSDDEILKMVHAVVKDFRTSDRGRQILNGGNNNG